MLNKKRIRVLIILNYYYPYISGVSEYARVLAEELVQKGYQVTVLSSNYAKLNQEEMIHGVKVYRAPIICKISKGTISPAFIRMAVNLSLNADIINMHLPMIESGVISTFLKKQKLITTYHCDINLQRSFINTIIIWVMDRTNKHCLKNSSYIAVQTIDYATHSRIAKFFPEKLFEAATPIKEYKRKERQKEVGKKVIGFCGRLVEEKGIDILLKAYEQLQKEDKDIFLKIGGDYKNIAGGSVYESLRNYIEMHQIKDVCFAGMIPEAEMEEFYSSLDVFVLPSVNALEAFGMVQIEAMLCGVPVVASDLYGVRTIVQKTGMGVVVKQNDVRSLADGIKQVLQNPLQYKKSRENILKEYATEKCIGKYESIIKMIVGQARQDI